MSENIKKIKLLPGIIIVIIQWIVRFAIHPFFPDALLIAVLGGVLGGLVVIIWWTFFSRAPLGERLAGFGIITGFIVLTHFLLHKSISTGNMGLMFILNSFPFISAGIVLWAAFSRKLKKSAKLLSLTVVMLLICGAFTLLRSRGIDGEGSANFTWRWSKTSEEILLEENDIESKIAGVETTINTTPLWSGFRGKERNGSIKGLKINTDWQTSAPRELWRKEIGPGCSSFAASETHFFTQEQRGEYEMVTCYELETGKPVWVHQDSARFWDSHCGAGPRSTPALHNNRIYTLGATGIFNALDANTGNVIWQRNAQIDTDAKQLNWAFCGSPLVVDSLVIATVSGCIIAYDINTGEPVWKGPHTNQSYSSPHLMDIGGVKQILFVNIKGITSFNPADGSVLWNYQMAGEQILQPALISEDNLIVSKGNIGGLCRLDVSKAVETSEIKELWLSAKIKPNHNDFVVHKGYIYGYNGPFLVCIDAKTGERKWRGGRLLGWILLLADQDLLLILTEKGEIVTVEANPDKYTELGKIHGITGRTWNHPAIANDILLVRNNKEMAAFKLPK